jgi:fibronectin-binding autotransporter adhesin
MPGFLGGSSGSSGTGGEISFPKEFIDPVTKLRVSEPTNLIDTDFEYGLQPTKWETVELINNTPSFFSKGGDTTIPNILSIITNEGTREITVTTALEHGLSIGIPINVTGTKSVTADGAYIINSIPNTTTFTYLCRDNQPTTASIEDLYSSIITGEFFQGSQIRISDARGIETDGEATSTLTVTTPSPHGFGVNTPFYFLNLNSTVSQEFEAANTAAKSFDASNSATAQTFDGSNTLSSVQVDWTNSATSGGTASTVTAATSPANDTITVSHTTENFVGKAVGTPLYYNVSSASGYFADNPRGVVFLKTVDALASGSSTFKVSVLPDGDPIDITASMTGTFQLANQARLFAGNNLDPDTQLTIAIVNDTPKVFDGDNSGGSTPTTVTSTVTSYSGSLVNVTGDAGTSVLNYYTGAMLKYTTTGSAATGLTNNATYFVDTFFQQGSTNNFSFTLKPLPSSTAISSISGGTGTQKFQLIGISPDRDVVHIPNHGYVAGDMLRYDYPALGRFTANSLDETKDYYFVETVYDIHNITLGNNLNMTATSTNSAVTTITDGGQTYEVHSFATVGSGTITFSGTGFVDALVVAGGGAGGSSQGGAYHESGAGGGAGGLLYSSNLAVSGGTYNITVGAGGVGSYVHRNAGFGGNSTFTGTGVSMTSIGGGRGNGEYATDGNGGSGGGGAGNIRQPGTGVAGPPRQGYDGGYGEANGSSSHGGGGGGAGGTGGNASGIGGNGGSGLSYTIRTGSSAVYAGGGGGGPTQTGGTGGLGTDGGGGRNTPNAYSGGGGGYATGFGGGGGGHRINERGGNGFQGIVVIRFRK